MRTLISILWISFFPLAAAAQGDDLSYRLKKVIKDKKAEIGHPGRTRYGNGQ